MPFIRADVPNGNKHLYPREVLEAGIRELKKRLPQRNAYGGSRHLKKGESFEVPDISHFVENMEMEKDGTVTAILRVVPTEKGKDVITIIKNGGRLGVSARGYGEMRPDPKQEGVARVQAGWRLDGVDFCLTPAGGLYASAAQILESAPLDAEEHLEEEADLKRRFEDAVVRSGFKGDFETFKMSQDREGMDLVFKFRERLAQARKAGFKGTETQYLDAMEKQ